MLKPLTIITTLAAVAISFAQTLQIKVLDNDNLLPVNGVYLYDSDGGIDSTDVDGRVNLHELKDDATVLFKHRLYKSKELSYSTLKKKKTVKMVPVEGSTEETAAPTGSFTENKDSVPYKKLVLNKKNMELYNPRTSTDLLAATDEVFIQKNGQGAGCPMIRGFSANALLFTIDGVRMNNAIYRSDNLQNLISLDPSALESAEVIFGPGSTLYGSGAMGGVFNFHFKDPVLSSDGSVEKSGMAMGRFSAANMEKTGSVNFKFSKNNVGSFTAITFSNFGDVRMGNDTMPLIPSDTGGYYDVYGRKNYMQGNTPVANANPAVQKYSGYSVFNVLEKVRMAVNSDVALNGSLYFSTTGHVPRYDKLIEPNGDKLKYSEWYYGPQRWLLSAIALEYSKPQPLFAAAKATLSYQNYKESSHSRSMFFSTDELKNDTASVNVVSATVDCKKPLGERSVLTYGIEAAYNSVKSAAGNENIATGQTNRTGAQYPDGSNDYVTGDIYSYFKTCWNPTVTSVAGARYSRFYLHSMYKDLLYNLPGREIKINAGSPSGCLGVIIQPFDFWRMTLNGSTGFRAPDISDFSNTNGEPRVLSDNLEPEYVYSFEFGNNVELGKNIGLEATTFISQAQNRLIGENIAYNGVAVPSLSNNGTATIGGGNINVTIRFSNSFSLKNTVTFTAGLDSEQTPLYAVPPLFGATHFLFRLGRVNGDFYMRYNGRKSKGQQATDMIVPDDQIYLYPVDNNGDYFSPSWYTLNLATTTILTKNLDLNLGVENIFNKCYRPYANGIAAPGTNLVCSIRGKL